MKTAADKLTSIGTLDYNSYMRLKAKWSHMGRSYKGEIKNVHTKLSVMQNDVITVGVGEVVELNVKQLTDMRTYAILQGYLEVKR